MSNEVKRDQHHFTSKSLLSMHIIKELVSKNSLINLKKGILHIPGTPGRSRNNDLQLVKSEEKTSPKKARFQINLEETSPIRRKSSRHIMKSIQKILTSKKISLVNPELYKPTTLNNKKSLNFLKRFKKRKGKKEDPSALLNALVFDAINKVTLKEIKSIY